MLSTTTLVVGTIIVAGVIVTGVVCRYLGGISSKVKLLERQFDNHYHTITDTTQRLQGEITAIHQVLSKLDNRTEAIHKDIRDFMQDLREKKL